VVVFAADAGKFAASGGYNAGVTVAEVAPAQVGMQVMGSGEVAGVAGVGHRELS
jgi:hypothetical protein